MPYVGLLGESQAQYFHCVVSVLVLGPSVLVLSSRLLSWSWPWHLLSASVTASKGVELEVRCVKFGICILR